jgi:hypothetical protein
MKEVISVPRESLAKCYDRAFHLLLEHWRQAVDQKRRAMQPPELTVVPIKTESNWRKILRECFGIKL